MSPKHRGSPFIKKQNMEIVIKRTYFRDHFVMGFLQVDKVYVCDTLEPRAIDWQKEKKKAGLTAIPEGHYRVVRSYSKTFKRMMPYLVNVPEFSGIMFHTGNVATKPNGSVGDSRGCILVGKSEEEGALTQSRIHFNKLDELIAGAEARGEAVWVRIVSHHEWTYNK